MPQLIAENYFASTTNQLAKEGLNQTVEFLKDNVLGGTSPSALAVSSNNQITPTGSVHTVPSGSAVKTVTTINPTNINVGGLLLLQGTGTANATISTLATNTTNRILLKDSISCVLASVNDFILLIRESGVFREVFRSYATRANIREFLQLGTLALRSDVLFSNLNSAVIASADQAQAGTSSVVLMTPATTKVTVAEHAPTYALVREHYTSNDTYRTPASSTGWDRKLHITAVGGGGSGAPANGTLPGSGGGAGGFAQATFSNLPYATNITITVGVGGTANGTNSVQRSGKNSTVAIAGVTLVTARGGAPGQPGHSRRGGIGGQATLSDGGGTYPNTNEWTINGNAGDPSIVASQSIGGTGGAGIYGGAGAGGAHNNSNTITAEHHGHAGSAASGAGGGGGAHHSGTGGDGGSGFVFIEGIH